MAPLLHQAPLMHQPPLMHHNANPLTLPVREIINAVMKSVMEGFVLMCHHLYPAPSLEDPVLLTKTAVNGKQEHPVVLEYVIHNQITELPQNSGFKFEIKPHTL